jgi:hypothetical protein
MNYQEPQTVIAKRQTNAPFVVQVGGSVTLDDIHDVAVHRREIVVAPDIVELLRQGRRQLEDRLAGR